MSKKKSKGGRPNVYDTRIAPFLDVITLLKEEGKTDYFIAKLLKINQSTLITHRKKIEEYSQAYTQGQQRMVDRVEATLFDVAMGRTQRKVIKVRKNAEGKITSTEETIEMLPPDVSAIIFLLKGHRRALYNEKAFEQDVIEIPENETFATKFLGAIDEKTGR